MTTIQIELPDAMAQAAREAGLLTPQALDRLLNDALKRQQAADALLSIADRVAAAGIEPMSMEKINAEVKAARAERKQRAGGLESSFQYSGECVQIADRGYVMESGVISMSGEARAMLSDPKVRAAR